MSKPPGGKGSAPNGSERRRAVRRPVLETFSLFVVLPKKGHLRLPIHDVSDLGLSFDLDTEGEAPELFPIALGEKFDIHFYLNQRLYLPLAVTVRRVEEKGTVRSVGVELLDKITNEYKAFQSFLHMFDAIIETARFNE